MEPGIGKRENMENINIKKWLKNKRVLITGCCGTIGTELVHQLLTDYEVKELICLDNNESELFFLEESFANHFTSFLLADVRDRDRLIQAFQGVNVVFHTAAFKHVTLCERSPFEAVQTNIDGVQNVIVAAYESNVERVVFTSSDKAVNPTNVMGTSKLMGERLMTAANSNRRGDTPVFASTRFGNVLGSRGSVLLVFRDQIAKGGPVTLTDPGMTRFIMSIRQAVQLVIDSLALAQGGEVFVTKMPVIRIKDLAEVMIRELAPNCRRRPEEISIQSVGAKPGEKFYEELMNIEETRRTIELARYFVVKPAFSHLYQNIKYDYPGILSETVSEAYNSSSRPALSQEELRTFLYENRLLG
jgi:FlaA1/EpsC-like NDP-sugar epimerase